MVKKLSGFVLLAVCCGCSSSEPAAKPAGNPEVKRSLDELSRKLKDPRVSKCFQAAFAMGKSLRQQGAMRPSDAQLHQYALQACVHFKVPQDMRGVAVEKFKNGFGWGWSAGP